MKLQKAYPEPYRLSFHKRVPLSCGLFTLGNLAASAISSPRELWWQLSPVISHCQMPFPHFFTSPRQPLANAQHTFPLTSLPLRHHCLLSLTAHIMPKRPPHPITSFSAWPRGPHPTPQPAAPLLMKVKSASSTQIPLLSLRASPDDRGHPLHSHCLGQTGSLENLNSGIQIPYLSGQESL